MKKNMFMIVFIIFSLFFPIGINVYAQTTQDDSVTVKVYEGDPSSVVPLVSPTVSPVEYVLPYPGILPDHPLFFLKKLRDLMMEILIADPVKKSEFYLLQSDKRMSMAMSYHQNGSYTNALVNVGEAYGYFVRSLETLEKYISQKKPAPGFLVSKLSTAAKKHAEIITGFSATSSQKDADRFVSFLQSYSDIVKRSEQLDN